MIGNLLDALLEAHSEHPDHRYKQWAKRITRVDTSKSNGYAFEGDFVDSGTVEYEPGPALFLVAVTNGSRKYNTTHYEIIYMDDAGNYNPLRNHLHG